MSVSILMVCTGNICRSPLAEAEMRRIVPKLKISSAGTSALVGKPADPKAIQVATENALNLSRHLARQLDGHLITSHELIFAMDSSQRKWIIKNYPQIRGRVFLLTHWSGAEDIPDPYGGEVGRFEVAYRLIKAGCLAWKSKLKI